MHDAGQATRLPGGHSGPKPAEKKPIGGPIGNRVPDWATGALVLADGRVLWGQGIGVQDRAVGEVCFNTSMTGYQEILTDPSYAGQIITFTFPHIGNVGTNEDDMESDGPTARGCLLHAPISDPSSWRAGRHLDAWLKKMNLIGLAGVDTRTLTLAIRDGGAPNAAIVHFAAGAAPDLSDLHGEVVAWPGLEGMDLAAEVTTRQTYKWRQTQWQLGSGYSEQTEPRHKVVAVDFGAKKNILRCLAETGCEVTVVPATATAQEILDHAPAGIFLSNGPGDPAATGQYAVPMIREILARDIPVFGICLGHQMLALALGASTSKMHHGHRGANHPVKDLQTGKVEITSQNHGFVVDEASLPKGVKATHRSLFDGTLEGLSLEGKPVFSVQFHPEASPGPQDSHYLFARFVAAMDKGAKSEAGK